MKNKLTFEDWYAANEDEISIELAETGADREMCFNAEAEFELRYEMYLAKPEQSLRPHQIGIIGMAAMINPFILSAVGHIGKSGHTPMAIAHRTVQDDSVIRLNGKQFRRILWTDDRITRDVVDEVELIMQKKSKFSRRNREYLMYIFNLSFKPVTNG